MVIPEDTDAIVYAAWAMDKNKNGIPDYSETPVSIIYDKNGGDGEVPDTITGVLPGAAYPLETAPNLTKNGNIFAGWSMSVPSGVINKTGSEAIIKSLVTSPFTVPATSEDVKLYAVYAADTNNNGKSDYCEDALHVEYYINDGQVRDGYTVDSSGMFYICNDYHHPGENATLLAVEYGSTMICRENAVLIGWSSEPRKTLVMSEDEAGGLLITSVNLTSAAANAKVYALWAVDANNNGIADYMELTLNHTYHPNQFLSNSSGSTLESGEYLKIEKPVPTHGVGILPGTSVELAANDYLGTADLVDSEGNVKGHYIQVGWSAYTHGACDSQKDYDDWVIAGDANGYTEDGKYYRVIYDTRFQNAFAVWAPYKNENNTPDFLEPKYTVTLNLNGGTAGRDYQSKTTLDENAEFTFPADPTKAGHIFKGWSAEGDGRLYKAGDTITVTANVTYTALYDPITHTVTLDINGGTAGSDFAAENTVNDGESFTFPADPTKEDYIFLGWSTKGDKNLYKAGDTVTVNADVTYVAQYKAIHTVTLDLNGGTAGDGFEEITTVNEGDSFTFPADPTKAGYKFLGWSAEGDENLYKAGDTVTVTADITYVAQYEKTEPTPDDKYTVRYDTNGGYGTAPSDEIYSKGDKVELVSTEEARKNLTLYGAVLIGWSLERHEGIIQSQEEENSVKLITEIESIDADTTVYAVWAVDENENGIPDYDETPEETTGPEETTPEETTPEETTPEETTPEETTSTAEESTIPPEETTPDTTGDEDVSESDDYDTNADGDGEKNMNTGVPFGSAVMMCALSSLAAAVAARKKKNGRNDK